MQSITEKGEKPAGFLPPVRITGLILALAMLALVIFHMGLLDRPQRDTSSPANDSIQIDTEDMSFGFQTLRVTAGEPITLNIKNHDFNSHSFDVDELAIHVMVTPNGEQTFRFVPTEPGEYTIYCAIPGHRELGMVSTLIVAP